MTALTVKSRPAEVVPVHDPVPAPLARTRANSSCFTLIARFLIWATRHN